MQRISRHDFDHIVRGLDTLQKEPCSNVTEELEDQKETKETDRNRGRRTERAHAQSDLLSKPIMEFLITALKMNKAEMERTTNWLSPVWTFTRLCKGHPDLEKMDAVSAWSRVLTHLRQIHSQGVIDVWDQLEADEDEAGLDFTYSWDKVRVHPAKDVLQDANDRAGRVALKPPLDRGKIYARFISIMGHLQVIRREEHILVPVEVFAGILGCTKMTVSRMIKFAIDDGLLEIIEAHDYSRHKARRYKFAVARYPGI